MDNFNKEQILYCKYCGKQCKSLNSLKQHEIRCKENPNHIITNFDTNHNYINERTKGHKWLNNGISSKCVKPEDINYYLLNGWKLGMDNKLKNIHSKSLIGKSTGKASTPEKELLRKQRISNSMKGNTNWKFNKRHGNSKQGWYHNIHCDSTWELAFVVYHIENNLYIERCKQYFDFIWENEHHKYIPDFITNEGIIEIKGRKSKKSLEKEKQFPNIKVIDEHTIKPYLEYVKHKYGNNFWINLYEDYSKDYQDKQYFKKLIEK